MTEKNKSVQSKKVGELKNHDNNFFEYITRAGHKLAGFAIAKPQKHMQGACGTPIIVASQRSIHVHSHFMSIRNKFGRI